MKLKDVWDLIKETFKEWGEDKAARLAAALAYYTIFSIAPLLVIVIAIAGLVFDRTLVEQQLMNQVSALVGPEGTGLIETMIARTQDMGANILATLIGVGVLLAGATGVFGQLQDALNTIWGVKPHPDRGLMGMIKDRFFSFTMVLGIAFLLLVSLVLSAALAALNETIAGFLPLNDILLQAISFMISFSVITVLFAMIFKILPDAEVTWSDVWLGAAVTALLFSIGQWAIGLYLGNSDVLSTYGAAGSLVVILLWVYYSAQILFIGAEFTQVYANRFGSQIVPEEGAVPLTETERAKQGIPGSATGPAAEPEREPEETLPYRAPRRQVDPPDLLPQAQPSLLALSAVLAVLVGFISGLVIKRGNGKS